jgi:hypothetical protein
MTKPLQVLVFGHPLGLQTKAFLATISADVRIHKVFMHIPRFCDTLPHVKGVFDELAKQGLDLSGRTPTLIVPPGSSLASMAIVAAWLGVSGEVPKLLNLIKDPSQSGEWIPSPEAPVLDLHSFRHDMRQAGRRQLNGVERISTKLDRAIK